MVTAANYNMFSEEKQRMILEKEIRMKQGITAATACSIRRRLSSDEPSDATAQQLDVVIETEAAADSSFTTLTTTAESIATETIGQNTAEMMMKATGEILQDLQCKQVAAWKEVKHIKKIQNPATQAGYGSADDTDHTDVANTDSEIDDDDEWDLMNIPDGGSWDTDAVEEEELMSNSRLISSQSANAIMSMEKEGVAEAVTDATVFTPVGLWDPRMGGTIRRLDKNNKLAHKRRAEVGSHIVGSARHRKEAEIEVQLCGSALSAVKMLRKRSDGKLEDLNEDWEVAKTGKSVKYDTKEQGVSIIPEGGYDWSKMSVQQRAVVAENLKHYKLKQKREQMVAEEKAVCTFTPQINRTRRTKDGKAITSRVMQAMSRRPSTSPVPKAPTIRSGKSSPRKQIQLKKAKSTVA